MTALLTDVAAPVRGGVLSVTPQHNGPLAVVGPMEVLTGTGRTILKTGTAMLCRCGQSRTKPYCDGSHVAAGFKAE